MTLTHVVALLVAVPFEVIALLSIYATTSDLRPHHHPHRHRRTGQ